MDQMTNQTSTKYWKKGLKVGFVVLLAAVVVFTGFFVISHYTGHAQCRTYLNGCSLLDDLSLSFGFSLVFLWWWFIPAVLVIPWLNGLIIDGFKNFRVK
jgi:hypothetical protein